MLSIVNNDTASWTDRAYELATGFADRAAVHDRSDEFVANNLDALKAAGFHKALVPTEFGGGGASIAELCDVIRIIGAACGSTALAFSMHCHLVAAAAWRWKYQQAPTEGLLKRVAAEDLSLVSSGGSDWLESGGVAEKVDGGFRVTARKPFSSGSPSGDLLVTSAVYDDPDAGPTVLHFAVPLRGDGVAHLDTWQVMGMRGTGSNDIQLTNVFVADAAISGRRPAGEWHMLFHVISKIAFALIYAAYLGIAEGARDAAVAAVAKRPADANSARRAGEMELELLSARLAHRHMVEIAEHAEPGMETTSTAMAGRTLVGRHAIATVEKAMELAGGMSFYRKSGLERAFRDVQAARFHPLQLGPQLDLSGRVALGWDVA
ncbi:acyl-CoA dehydrogenase family protein [Sphingomonas mesophila]|uniref:acyl-CoA dehydrogenase family protein n=1 Tax=Sphingomonas mesophila TaxID=2303576 RepID=UPI000E586F22|nr:acyl-CoA dehydrogenase family protein [Sphingomonas mesophila]